MLMLMMMMKKKEKKKEEDNDDSLSSFLGQCSPPYSVFFVTIDHILIDDGHIQQRSTGWFTENSHQSSVS